MIVKSFYDSQRFQFQNIFFHKTKFEVCKQLGFFEFLKQVVLIFKGESASLSQN